MAHQRIQLVTEQGVTEEPLEHGVEGNRHTLRIMAQYIRQGAVDERVRALAVRIVADVPSHDFHAQAEAIFNYVHTRIKYVRDPKGRERVQSVPFTLFKAKAGDCGDLSEALAALNSAIGLTSRLVVIAQESSVIRAKSDPNKVKLRSYDHVYVETEIDGELVEEDATPPESEFGWEGKGVFRATYGIFGAEANQLAGLKSTFKKIGHGLKKVGKIALPLAAGFIPGVGGIASSAASAGFDALDARSANKQARQQAQQQQAQQQAQLQAAAAAQQQQQQPQQPAGDGNLDLGGMSVSPVIILGAIALLFFLKR